MPQPDTKTGGGTPGSLPDPIAESAAADQDFADTFDLAEQSITQPDLTQADDPSNVPPEAPATPSSIVAPLAAGEEAPPNPPSDGVTPSPPPQPGESDTTYEQRWKTLQGIHRHDKESWEAEKARLQAELDLAKATVTPPSTTPPTTPPVNPDTEALSAFYDSLTDEQKEALKEYDEEFDTVSKMEGLKREAALSKLRKEISDLKAEVAAQLAPAAAFVKESKEERAERELEAHFNAIREGHPDFETYRDDGSILAWIESKPAYLRAGMKNAYEKGTAEDIIELISGFKADSGIQGTLSTPQNVIPIDKRKQDRIQGLTLPATRKGAVNARMQIASDFEGAFDEALNK